VLFSDLPEGFSFINSFRIVSKNVVPRNLVCQTTVSVLPLRVSLPPLLFKQTEIIGFPIFLSSGSCQVDLLQSSFHLPYPVVPTFLVASLFAFWLLPRSLPLGFFRFSTVYRASVFTNASFLLLLSEDFCFKYLLASQCALI
jgi:hypothetical protein